MNDFPLADLHVHLLADLDDGPRTWDDALAMCRIAVAEGVTHTVALAHQSERWNLSPDTIREAVVELRQRLATAMIPLEVFPAAEVMATPDLADAWAANQVLSVGDHGRFVLVEMPHQLFVDLGPVVRRLATLGVRIILAHPERHAELLHEPGPLEELIRMGCLVQVSSGSLTRPANRAQERALKSWVRRGCVHLLGSDGHSPRSRRPLISAAAARIREWVGPVAGERICGATGRAILRGEPVEFANPTTARRWWPARVLGAA
ncbi:MAG TPA: CpsB/CapC family capsule biosynthesis tyrosine phosphatase [Gemmataceae bacterium]|nr:CpsB/CapC family capsule biosynthesis tyrosine phosphatase [Gemmataceae bacterium]